MRCAALQALGELRSQVGGQLKSGAVKNAAEEVREKQRAAEQLKKYDSWVSKLLTSEYTHTPMVYNDRVADRNSPGVKDLLPVQVTTLRAVKLQSVVSLMPAFATGAQRVCTLILTENCLWKWLAAGARGETHDRPREARAGVGHHPALDQGGLDRLVPQVLHRAAPPVSLPGPAQLRGDRAAVPTARVGAVPRRVRRLLDGALRQPTERPRAESGGRDLFQQHPSACPADAAQPGGVHGSRRGKSFSPANPTRD